MEPVLPILSLLFLLLQQGAPGLAGRIDSIARMGRAHRTIAVDDRLAADLGVRVGDRLIVSSSPGDPAGDTVIVAAITRRRADPSEVARSDYRVRLHLDHLQALVDYGDRVDRFAVATPNDAATDSALRQINAAAFGFRAHRSRDIAVETSKAFQVVSRFHRAIGVITIVASAIFLLCIMLIKVDERRRDVAALRLMGISRQSVVRSVVLESALVALLGSGLGVLLGWLSSLAVNQHYQAVYRTPLKFSILTTETVALAVTLSVILGIGAGAIAAARLARTPPLALFGR